MRAVVLEADWEPRDGARLSEADRDRRWSARGREAWRNPRFGLRRVDDPGLRDDGDVIVRVGACGVCGSDVHLAERDPDGYIGFGYHLRCPVIPGHEVSGEVVAAGSSVRDIRVGDLVALESIQWCGNCYACRGGYPNSCSEPEDIGFTLDGGFSEYVRAPRRAVWSLEEIAEAHGSAAAALELGALCEPASCVYEGMFTRARGFQPGASVVVFGGGPIGLIATALARAAGAAHVITVEPGQDRRNLALRLGASAVIDPRTDDVVAAAREITGGVGVGMAIEATGSWSSVLPDLVACLGVGGKAVVIGIDAQIPPVDLSALQLRAGALYGSVAHAGGWNFPHVIALLATRRLDLSALVSERTGFTGLSASLAAIADGVTVGKVLITPDLVHATHAAHDGNSVPDGSK